MLRLAIFAMTVSLAACLSSDDGGTAAELADDLVGQAGPGKADGFGVIAAEVGGSYRLAVEKKVGSAVTSAHAKVLRFSVHGGQTIAAVVRRTDTSALDPFLALYDNADGRLVRKSELAQAWIPMAAESDAVAMFTPQQDGSLLLFASDVNLAVPGSFQVDLLPASGTELESVDVSVTNPTLRALNAQLRTDEPQVAAYVAVDALREGPDGLLQRNEAALSSLQERAKLRSLADSINGNRVSLFGELVRASTGRRDAALEAKTGAASGATWARLRDAAHALP